MYRPNKYVLLSAFLCAISTHDSLAAIVPLFDATPITASPTPDANFGIRYVVQERAVTTYCTSPGIGQIKGVYPQGDAQVLGPPLTDNFITGNDVFHSLCQGGYQLPALMTGGMCFTSVPGPLTVGAPMQSAFDATGITAPVPLPAGANAEIYRLWDYGVVYGNVKLVLELPQQCSPKSDWCSPGYWKNHPQSWTLPKTAPFMGITAYNPSKRACVGKMPAPNLWEVVSNPSCYGGEAANAVADLLSTAHPGVEFYGTRNDSCPLN